MAAAVARLPGEAGADAPAAPSAPAAAAPAAAAKSFVPIRPAFRPLLPKPAATAGEPEPTVVLKSKNSGVSKLFKRRKNDVALPATVAPVSLISKRRKSPPLVRKLRIESASATHSPLSSTTGSPADEFSDSIGGSPAGLAFSPESLDGLHGTFASGAAPSMASEVAKSAVATSALSTATATPTALSPAELSQVISSIEVLDDNLVLDAGLTSAGLPTGTLNADGLAGLSTDLGADLGAGIGLYSPESLPAIDAHLSAPASPVSLGFELRFSDLAAAPEAEDVPTLNADLWPAAEPIAGAANEELSVDPLAVDALSLNAYFTDAAPAEEYRDEIDPMDFFGPAMDIF